MEEAEIQTFISKRRFKVGVIAKKYKIAGKYNVPIYDHRIVPYIAELAMERPKKRFDTIFLITGQRRCGKSTLAFQIARCIDNNFDERKIAFRIEEFGEIIQNNPECNPEIGVYPQVIMDEAGYDLLAQNWMERMQKELVKRFEVIGARRQIIYLVLPHKQLLNRSIRNGMIHYWINVSTFENERGFAELRMAQENIWKLETFWKPLCAFTFEPCDDDPIWKQYLVKKDAFIDSVMTDIEDTSKTRELKKQRAMLIKHILKTEKMSQKELAEKFDLPFNVVRYASIKE